LVDLLDSPEWPVIPGGLYHYCFDFKANAKTRGRMKPNQPMEQGRMSKGFGVARVLDGPEKLSLERDALTSTVPHL
jgi:hypothetical protein